MGTRKVEQGSAGRNVAANVKAHRENLRLSLQDLSVRMGSVGRPILASGLSKIEQGDRRVDVDDLVALATALETTPARMLASESDVPALDVTPEQQERLEAAERAVRAAEAAGWARVDVWDYLDLRDTMQKLAQTFKRGRKNVQH